MKTKTTIPGFILMNSGAPVSTAEVDIRRYHKEVAKDHRTTRLPHGVDEVIHPNRDHREAAEYRKIWTTDGSPLVHTCEQIRDALQQRISAPVEIAMLHSEPHVMDAVGKLLDKGVTEVRLLPMYPQYSIETHEACVDKVLRELRIRKSDAKIRVAPPFYAHPSYITPLADAVKDTDHHILFSYRGLSIQHLKQPDKHGHCLSSMECCNEPSGAHDTCYRFQCLKTTRLIAQAAGLTDDRYSVGFDANHTAAKCIQPYTVDVLQRMPAHGHLEVTVICPAHYCDGLETLEHVNIHGRAVFIEAGGKSFRMIPALGNSEAGLTCIESLIRESDHWLHPFRNGQVMVTA